MHGADAATLRGALSKTDRGTCAPACLLGACCRGGRRVTHIPAYQSPAFARRRTLPRLPARTRMLQL